MDNICCYCSKCPPHTLWRRRTVLHHLHEDNNRLRDPDLGEKVFYVVDRKLEMVESIACTIRGQSWSATLHAMKVSSVLDIVGIWKYSNHIYILRKHPGLAMLSNEEKEEGDFDEDEDEDDEPQ